MSNKLKITYEGTSKVKEAQTSALVNEYELLKIVDNENIETMFTRFSKIINELNSPRMVYSNALQVKKTHLRSPKT